MSIAQVSDVATELGSDIEETSAEGKQIQKWLDRVERKIRQRIPLLDKWCEDDDYKAGVIDIESAAVARKALNPEGIRSLMAQVDDGNIQKTIDTSRSAGEVTILDDEWDELMKTISSDLSSTTISPDPFGFPLPEYPSSY